MIKGILAYLGVFLFTLYWFFMFDDEVMTVLLILEVSYLVFAVLFCFIARSKISVSMKNTINTAEKNQKVPVRAIVKNQSKLVTVHYCLYFKLENTLTGEKTKIKYGGTVGKRAEKIVSIPMSACNCGNMVITLKKIKIYDCLMILGIMKKIKETIQIRILPELHLLPVEVTRRTRDFITDTEEYSDMESGDDPLAVFQIREYNEQDSIRDIHWKLSARTNELLVKDRGKALGSSVLIWINTSGQNKRFGKKAKILNTKKKGLGNNYFGGNTVSVDILELAASLSLSLFEEKCIHTVVWYETESDKIMQKRVSREEHIYELLNRMAMIKPDRDEKEAEVKLKEVVRMEKFSTIVEIKSQGELNVNGNRIEVPRNKGKIQWNQLIFTV